MALSGDVALVGAVGEDLYTGAAYVFVRSGSVWSEQQKLTASDAAASDYFGSAVALSGDTALVGAVSDDHAADANAGSAYVFTLTDCPSGFFADGVCCDTACGASDPDDCQARTLSSRICRIDFLIRPFVVTWPLWRQRTGCGVMASGQAPAHVFSDRREWPVAVHNSAVIPTGIKF